ncbi:hypothetical protein V1515DRAFT_583071 [Lipomyces mesembrius]
MSLFTVNMIHRPAIHVTSEISTTRGISDSSAEHDKPLNLDSSSESPGSATEISSAMLAAVSRDIPLVKGDTIVSESENVFTLLRENPPENILDVYAPYSKYIQ